MFESYLVHQRVDPQIRRRFTFALCGAVAATLGSGVLLWSVEKMHITRVGAPTSDFLLFALDQVEPPPPPAPPAAPAAAAAPVEVDDVVDDIVESIDIVTPDETPDELPKPKRTTGDVLARVGAGGNNPFGVPGGDPTSTCLVGCGPAIAKPVTDADQAKAPREVEFSALDCRVCPDPDQKRLQHTGAAMMGKHGLSNRTYFCVESNGRIASVSTRHGSGDKDVDRIIKETVRGWRFAPMVVDGRPRGTCSTASFDIRFE